MRSPERTTDALRSDQGGWVLVEVIVAGLLLTIVSLGAFKALDASQRSTAEERHRARASALAEADISRMRSMRISSLSNLQQTRTIRQDNQRYTITSRAEYQTDSTGTASCEAGAASADYIKVSSTVTWPSMGNQPPVVSATLVAPPNGSVSPNSGALAIAVEDAGNVGVPGVGISGSGAGSFSGSTGPTGCVIFGNLPAGTYTVSVAGVAAGLVDRNGAPPAPVTTSVVGESTNTLVLQYDDPGTAPVTFKTRNYQGTVVNSVADSVVFYNTGLSVARRFGTINSPATSISGTSLFPFTSDYAVYAGTCEGDNPNPSDLDPPPAPLAIGSALVPPGGQAPTVDLLLPALHLNVFTGSSSSSPGTRVNWASGVDNVKVWDTRCGNQLRTFRTSNQGSPALGGRLANPGLPFSDYTVCAQGTVSGNTRRRTVTNVDMNTPDDITRGTVLNIYLSDSSSQTGNC